MNPGKAKKLLEDISREWSADRFKPSRWEGDFIDSIDGRVADGRPLTQNQADKLEQIHEKACP